MQKFPLEYIYIINLDRIIKPEKKNTPSILNEFKPIFHSLLTFQRIFWKFSLTKKNHLYFKQHIYLLLERKEKNQKSLPPRNLRFDNENFHATPAWNSGV